MKILGMILIAPFCIVAAAFFVLALISPFILSYQYSLTSGNFIPLILTCMVFSGTIGMAILLRDV